MHDDQATTKVEDLNHGYAHSDWPIGLCGCRSGVDPHHKTTHGAPTNPAQSRVQLVIVQDPA